MQSVSCQANLSQTHTSPYLVPLEYKLMIVIYLMGSKSCHCQKRWSITLTRASDVKGYIHDAHRGRYRCSAMRCKGLAGGGQSCLRLLPGSVISVNLVLDSQTLDAA